CTIIDMQLPHCCGLARSRRTYYVALFFFTSYAHLRPLHSFPTRRSSELASAPAASAPKFAVHFSSRKSGWLVRRADRERAALDADRKSTRLNSSHVKISYAVFCLKKKKKKNKIS